MQKVFKQTPLYRFLMVCNEEGIGKKILDCGAGGQNPPLSLFASYGYETEGIDLDPEQVEMANHFGARHQQNLNVNIGDMTQLNYPENSFDCIYSYNSVFHMKKSDVNKAITEMKRVLKPDGLMFVNFLSVDDFRCGEGPSLGNNQYEQMDDEPVIHSYYDYKEADVLFTDMEFLYKETRVIERMYENKRIKQGFIDYIVRK